MDRIFPGFSRFPWRVRRAIGYTLLAIVGLSAVVPIIAFASMGPACGGGYPDTWCKEPLDTVVDSWGMYNRECVSYTAYRVALSGRMMPYGFGDANEWPAAAQAYGLAVDRQPKAGDVAIRQRSSQQAHGHSMYVESVNGDGTINISQYNVNKTGTFSQDRVRTNDLIFIHF